MSNEATKRPEVGDQATHEREAYSSYHRSNDDEMRAELAEHFREQERMMIGNVEVHAGCYGNFPAIVVNSGESIGLFVADNGILSEFDARDTNRMPLDHDDE